MTAPATAPIDEFSVFLPFTKVSEVGDGTIRVHSVINDETVDDQGEILDYAGTKAALDDFMKWANVREMHQPSAVGVVDSITHDDLAKTTEGILHVVDAAAVAKVMSGVYKGTSLGGSKGPIREMQKVAGKSVTRIKQPYVTELSLVDRPSRATAELTLLKRSDVAEEAPVSDTTTAAAPESPAADAPADVDAAATPSATGAAAAETTPAAPEGATEVPAAPGPSDAVEAPDKPLEQAAATGDLSKAAADDAWDMASEAGYLLTLAEREEKEGDTEGAARIKRIAQSLLGEAATEADEVGTPENTAQLEAEAEASAATVGVVDPFYYAAVTGDLAKRAVALAKASAVADPDPQLDTLISLAKAAGGRCDHDLVATPATSPTDIAPETLAKFADALFSRSSDQLLEKVTTAIGPLVRPDALDVMKGELLEALGPIKDELAKIAAQPAAGGAFRFAPTERFGADGALSPSTEAEVLAKAAAATADPVAKEALGRLAATAQIRADHASTR